jgi:hypothetical protein
MNRAGDLLVAQNLGEYGALAGGGSGLQRLMDTAERAVRTPETAIPLGLLALAVAYFLLRRK